MSESTQALGLVPHVTQSFPVVHGRAAQQPQENSLVVYNSKGTNAVLNKALKKSVLVVERRITSVRSSFVAVGEIVGDKAFQNSTVHITLEVRNQGHDTTRKLHRNRMTDTYRRKITGRESEEEPD